MIPTNYPEALIKEFLALPEEQQSIVKEFWEGYNRLSEEQKKILVRRILEHHT